MAVELFEGTNSSHIAPVTRDRSRNYYSDREDTRTPPPDYDKFISDNDLPSVRTRLRMENGSLKETSSRGDYNRVCFVCLHSFRKQSSINLHPPID